MITICGVIYFLQLYIYFKNFAVFMRKQARNDKLDETELKYDIEWSSGNIEVSGWVANVKTHSYQDESEREIQVLLVFIGLQDGRWVKC